MTAPAEHALLSASAASRWMHCTPAPRLEETLPESTSTYAEEGRVAHDLADLKILKLFLKLTTKAYNKLLKDIQANSLYQDEMTKHTDIYADYVSQIVHSYAAPPYIATEKRLDYSTYVPEGFGTGDCIVIGGSTLHVIDFKYGKGVPVSAERNPQMMLYALGAISAYSLLYSIDTVKMAIVQPRLDTISEWECSAEELIKWGTEVVKPLAETAFAGQGEFAPGEHCRFCRAKALCRARTEAHTALEDFKPMLPPLISHEEVGQLLARARDLAKWVSDLEDYALKACLQGETIPGWKAVEGRSTRRFIDHDAAFTVLKTSGIEEAMLYERKPITLAATETLLGKARFKELLGAMVSTPPGKPALALETDKRAPITRQTAADDFNTETEE